MKEERLQILRMIQEGTITSEEGARLLAALGSERPREATAAVVMANPGMARRWLRIRMVDPATNNARINLTIPLSLLDWGLRLVERGGVNLAFVQEALRGGAEGKILEMQESETGERIEIFVE